MARRDTLEDGINAKLDEEMLALEAFKERELEQLRLQLPAFDQAGPARRNREEQARHEIDAVHDEYLTWIQETMTTERQPWIKVICAMTPMLE